MTSMRAVQGMFGVARGVMHGLARVVVLLAVALALGVRVVAADLLVEVGNPNAYQTLQAALDAASPGDRILIKGLLVLASPVFIRTSVTIESFDVQFADLLFVYGAGHGNARIIVDALAAGIPWDKTRSCGSQVQAQPRMLCPKFSAPALNRC